MYKSFTDEFPVVTIEDPFDQVTIIHAMYYNMSDIYVCVCMYIVYLYFYKPQTLEPRTVEHTRSSGCCSG